MEDIKKMQLPYLNENVNDNYAQLKLCSGTIEINIAWSSNTQIIIILFRMIRSRYILNH